MPGEGGLCYGKDAENLVLLVPDGTVIHDIDTGELIVDFSSHITQWRVLAGGKGGKGNAHFKTSTNQSPRRVGEGESGKELNLRLSLKVIADVGLLGMPNAGKSSLLSRISNARPKIANYPFTTLNPHLGTHLFQNSHQIVFADIPGLIEGASEGKGLGIDFLKHVERTRILVHMVEPWADNGKSPVENVEIIRKELENYSIDLASKPQLLVLSKSDLMPAEEDIKAWEAELGERFLRLSTVTGDGVDAMLTQVHAILREEDDPKLW